MIENAHKHKPKEAMFDLETIKKREKERERAGKVNEENVASSLNQSPFCLWTLEGVPRSWDVRQRMGS